MQTTERLLNWLTNLAVFVGILLGIFFISTLSVTTLAIGMGLVLLTLNVVYMRRISKQLEYKDYAQQRLREDALQHLTPLQSK